jgi:hypothetical protein
VLSFSSVSTQNFKYTKYVECTIDIYNFERNSEIERKREREIKRERTAVPHLITSQGFSPEDRCSANAASIICSGCVTMSIVNSQSDSQQRRIEGREAEKENKGKLRKFRAKKKSL